MTEMRTPTTKPAGELRSGDYITLPTRGDDVFDVRAVHTWRPMVKLARLDAAISIVSLTTGAADMLHGGADQVVTLATDEQVTAAREEYVRQRTAAELRELAELIVRHRLRISDFFEAPRISIRLADGEIERVAEAVGVGTSSYGPTSRLAVWPGPDWGQVVTADFVGEPAPEPAAVPETVPAEPGSDADQVVTEALADQAGE
ncbi:hypothetical protein ACIBJE_02300 [Micromonospora sp. NPDC050187]|uniref:hypothetical protein n=1 Tax=Micromonospora sp. NPDC050187 TaxID=3364277 RepID=UPI0037916909